MEVKTKSGFVCDIDQEVLTDDFELLEAVARTERGDKLAVFDVVNGLLGEDKPRLLEHCRGEHGRVSVAAVTAEVTEIFSCFGQTKPGKN